MKAQDMRLHELQRKFDKLLDTVMAKNRLKRGEKEWRELGAWIFNRLVILEDEDDEVPPRRETGFNDPIIKARYDTLIEVLEKISELEEGGT